MRLNTLGTRACAKVYAVAIKSKVAELSYRVAMAEHWREEVSTESLVAYFQKMQLDSGQGDQVSDSREDVSGTSQTTLSLSLSVYLSLSTLCILLRYSTTDSCSDDALSHTLSLPLNRRVVGLEWLTWRPALMSLDCG